MAEPAIVEFTVAGEPKARPRPRHGARLVRKPGGGMKAVSMSYHPTKIRRGKDGKITAESKAWVAAQAWYDAVARAARPHLPSEPWKGPVLLDIQIYFERPKYMLKKKYPDGPIPHTAKPDRDNCEKSVSDALEAAGLYENDSQVCAGEVRKWYAARGAGPGVVIRTHLIPADGSLFGGES